MQEELLKKGKTFGGNRQENNLCKFSLFSLLLVFNLSSCDFTPLQLPSQDSANQYGFHSDSQANSQNGSQASSQNGSQTSSQNGSQASSQNGSQTSSQNDQVVHSSSDNGEQDVGSEETLVESTNIGSQCTLDSDCVLVSKGCCGCSNGGQMIAIHSSKQAEYESSLKRTCSGFSGACQAAYLCKSFTTNCWNSTCYSYKTVIRYDREGNMIERVI